MPQLPPIKPLHKILKIHRIDLLQMYRRRERLLERIMRIERRGEEGRARQQRFEVHGEGECVGADGDGDGRFEEVSAPGQTGTV